MSIRRHDITVNADAHGCASLTVRLGIEAVLLGLQTRPWEAPQATPFDVTLLDRKRRDRLDGIGRQCKPDGRDYRLFNEPLPLVEQDEPLRLTVTGLIPGSYARIRLFYGAVDPCDEVEY